MTFKFDPFNIEEDSKAATDDTSKTTNTTNRRNKQQQQQQLVQQSNQSTLGQIPLHFSKIASANSKRLPPKLTVKLSYHEEVSSSCAVDGGLCRMFVVGKITVSIIY